MIEVAREDAEPMVGRGRRPLSLAVPPEGHDIGLHRSGRDLCQTNAVLDAPTMEVRQAARVGEDGVGRQVTQTERGQERLGVRFDMTGLVSDKEGRQAGALNDPESRHGQCPPSSNRGQTQ